MIVLYTSPGCASCRKVKQWLKDRNLPYVEKNIFKTLLNDSEIKHLLMLQRRLLYTGVTRAKKSLILLGEPGAFAKGVETLERHPRQTTLCRRLQERIPERDITEQ